jgi:L-lactate dehydrogenase (cytochrome)
MTVITSIRDLRELAQRRIPRAIFDYADGGAYEEITLRANRADLAALQLRQRVMIDVSKRNLATRIIGQDAAIPVALGPTGLCGLVHGDGEIHAARAAQAFGVPFCLSTMSICAIEDVRAAVKDPFWFQLYVMKDRGFTKALIERAVAAQCSALMLTVDLQIQGHRRRDTKNGLTVPPRLTLRNALDIATTPAWALKVLFGKRRSFGNLEGRLPEAGSLTTLAQWIGSQFDPSLTWKDLEWVRGIWPGKLILKGILDVEDAKIAAGFAPDAIVVSNHAGRQLDGAPSTISVLPPIVEAVGGKAEVIFDGGVQSGQDVLKALALGARSCLIGKAYLYALGALGGPGVSLALDILRKELDVSLALTGTTDVQYVRSSVLHRGAT